MIMASRNASIGYPPSLIDTTSEMMRIKNPCFVYGEYGRTEFIRLLSPNVKVYDSREIIDPKSLGGFYAVVDNELRYAQGVLVEAMLRGYHICFKRIDTNINLLHYLRSVVNDRVLAANNGVEITAHDDFRIFFTCKDILEIRNVAFIGKIQFTFDDVLGTFGDCRKSVVEILEYINIHKLSKCPRDRGLDCSGICLKEPHTCECHLKSVLCGKHFRMLCELRDTLNILSDGSKDASNSNRAILYQSFVNIFLKHESKALSETLYVSIAPLSLPNMLLAKTSPVEAALRSLILNIKKKKPTLLVGETGAGKTALIQYLCKNSEYFFRSKVDLKILNMSSDFDGSDLIGGYQSIDFDKKVKDLYKKAKLEIPKSLDKRVVLERLLGNCTGPVLDEVKLLLSALDKKVPFYYKEGVLTEAMKNGAWILMDEINLCSTETLGLIEAVLSKDEIVLYESGNFVPMKIHPGFMVFACMNPHGDFGKKKFDSNVFNRIIFYDFGYKLSCIRSVVQAITRNLVDEVSQISEFYYEFKRAVVNKEYTNIVEPLVSGRTLCRALNLILELKNDPNAVYNAFNLLFFTQLDLSSRSQALLLYRKHFKYIPPCTSHPSKDMNGFIITPKTKVHLDDVELAIKTKLPVLLQGDTSTGKTSLIFALASKYGRKVVRINNHEHTESSDYLGYYLTTKEGIRFKEGPLVTAMRNGSWVLLDELNLAPSDVLEALNRLLDDNRELYIPEIDEIVRPHANFRIFATQNINYSGRQGLAKSFRNRFVEVFFYEKDETEIKEILEKAYKMPPSFIRLMVGVYSTLKAERTVNSLVTLRDLFKWAKRGPTSYYEVFEIGMNIILERQRSEEDRNKVVEVFASVFRDRFNVEKRDFLGIYKSTNRQYSFMANSFFFGAVTKGLVLTRSYLKLIDLMYKAWSNYEPILLIGETGIGKTRICEAVSSLFRTSLKSINMHSGTESSDFIGHSILDKNEILWRDGPLVEAMIHGNTFLIDEINLAEDSVLERMNSVLESTRSLFVPETSKEIVAHDSFRVVATMNPGNDFGKRELSPALRSRFTEIYFELEQDEYEEIFCKMVDQLHIGLEHSEFFKASFDALNDISIRKIELICSHIKNLYFGESGCEDSFVFRDKVDSKEQIWAEVLEALGIRVGDVYEFRECRDSFGVAPYYIKKKEPRTLNYAFETETTRVNLQRIIRGLTLSRGLLLEGEPGVGKTSIIQSVADACGIKVLRVNLSEQTEMSDLVGTYLPIGDSIKFVESEMVSYMRKGYWIILDEINLCTQSVIEGLNSILDHRRRIDVDGTTVHVHSNTRIFGTMNPYNKSNGRKRLPKSFLDRFVVIYMDVYSRQDVDSILFRRYGKGFVVDNNLSLRGNIKLNDLHLLSAQSGGRLRVCSDTSIREEQLVSYEFENGKGRIGKIEFDYTTLTNEYVISHSQLPQIEQILKCMYKRIPVILSGDGGRSSLLKFISTMLGLKFVQINCHEDTDTCDLLGQYQKVDFTDTPSKSSLFVWQDSKLVKSLGQSALIVFNTPELVEKCVFDRLNALFEGEKSLNIYEKGIDTMVRVSSDCRLILCCDNPFSLSPALVDRCVTIHLSNAYSYIDLYKIFHTARPSGNPKRLCPSRPDNLFRDFLGIEHQYISTDLDLDIKRHRTYSTAPAYLNKSLSIYNTLVESEINRIFEIQPTECVAFDRELLDVYRCVESCSTPLPSTLTEKVNCLLAKPNLATLIKCFDFEQMSGPENHQNCRDVPANLFAYKYRFLEALKHKTLGSIQDLLHFSQNICKVRDISDVEFNAEAFSKLISSEDPLMLIRAEILNEKIRKENEISKKISETAKSMFKYGIGSLDGLIEEHGQVQEHYLRILAKIDKRLRRDYGKFKKMIQTLTFCDYLNDSSTRAFLESFNDISDYLLVHLFKNRNQCMRCGVVGQLSSSTKHLAIGLVKAGRYEKCMKYEYSKYLFNYLMHIPQKQHDLVLEAICFDEPLSSSFEAGEHEFTEDDIDDCIRHLFHNKTRAQVIDSRSTRISLGKDAISLLELGAPISTPDLGCCNKEARSFSVLEPLREMSIFSTPEAIINEIQSIKAQNEFQVDSPFSTDHDTVSKAMEKLQELDSFFKSLYKTESCLEIDKNYRYFQYFLFSPTDLASLERLFLGGSVHEFLDMIYFSECYLKYNYSAQLYNSVLRYKAFEIEAIHAKKLRETILKLKKEPKLYESTLSSYVDRFMYIPVVNALKISFDPPACQGIHEMKGPNSLFALIPSHLKQRSEGGEGLLCECSIWVELARKIDRGFINSIFNGGSTKDFVLHKFYSRTPIEPFSYPEICLAKALNNVMNNSHGAKYDEKTFGACLDMLSIGCEYVFPPYLYFVYKFSDSFELSDHLEEGTSLKSGEGRNSIKEGIKEEDIVDDFDMDEKDDLDSEGIDMDNQGELHSVSGEDEGESGVDPSDNEGEKVDDAVEDREVMGEENSRSESQNETGSSQEDNLDSSEMSQEDELTSDRLESVSEKDEDCNSGHYSTEEEVASDPRDDQFQYTYDWRESSPNHNQTCFDADGYNKKVEGGNLEEKDALKEGNGEEYAEGEGETGKEGQASVKSISFSKHPSDCTKLTSLLRIILESNRTNKYKGEFKSGKKLNLKKIVPYIASDYRKDRIWMRRQRSDKKNYILRIFIDNSRSMFDQKLIDTLSAVYYKIDAAFSLLNIPVQLYKFGSELAECRIEDLTFDESNTFINWTEDFDDGINIILTDGVFQNVGYAKDNFLVVMIDKGGIRKMSKVSVLENKVFVGKYLDSFALKYCILQNIEDLEKVFVEALADVLKNLL